MFKYEINMLESKDALQYIWVSTMLQKIFVLLSKTFEEFGSQQETSAILLNLFTGNIQIYKMEDLAFIDVQN